jgi:predicted transcriptional regulator
MNSEAILAVLPDSKEEAISLNEIALALGLDISTYTAMGRTKRQLSRALSALIRWGYVACEIRQSEEGHKAWYNAYWKTELAGSV